MFSAGSHVPHLLALIWFVLCWSGYTAYAIWKGRDTPRLASVLHLYREDWMRRLLLRENRVADERMIGSLEQSVLFFASSTLIILAGLFTLLGASDRTVSLLADLPLIRVASPALFELQLLCLCVVFVYAFFAFSWSLRQYGYAAILMCSAPLITERNVTAQELRAFSERTARVISLAGKHFNYGLRAYYFGLGMLAWFVNPWLFMLVTAGVVGVLYRREFHSEVLAVMVTTKTPAESSAEMK